MFADLIFPAFIYFAGHVSKNVYIYVKVKFACAHLVGLWGMEVYFHPFFTSALDRVNGHLRHLAALFTGHESPVIIL
jgi:hypothetical protein